MREPSKPVTDAIETALEEAPVTLGVLYGSHARREASERSDVDLAVAFEDGLSSAERTRARLEVIERLSAALGTDDVDVTPLATAPPELRREICADGVVLVGPAADFEAYCDDTSRSDSHTDRLAEFEDLLTEIERVV